MKKIVQKWTLGDKNRTILLFYEIFSKSIIKSKWHFKHQFHHNTVWLLTNAVTGVVEVGYLVARQAEVAEVRARAATHRGQAVVGQHSFVGNGHVRRIKRGRDLRRGELGGWDWGGWDWGRGDLRGGGWGRRICKWWWGSLGCWSAMGGLGSCRCWVT